MVPCWITQSKELELEILPINIVHFTLIQAPFQEIKYFANVTPFDKIYFIVIWIFFFCILLFVLVCNNHSLQNIIDTEFIVNNCKPQCHSFFHVFKDIVWSLTLSEGESVSWLQCFNLYQLSPRIPAVLCLLAKSCERARVLEASKVRFLMGNRDWLKC